MSLTSVPTSFMAGLTFDLLKGYWDYPATDYNSSLILINGSAKYSVNAVASGTDFNYVTSASGTSSWVAGDYSYSVIVSGTSTVYQAETGNITITPNLLTSTGTDTRSQVKKTLDNINAVLENKASEDVLSYTIAGRTIGKMAVTELLKLRNHYASLYSQEQRTKNGTSNIVRIQFKDPI